jgi:hypothetical protein
MRKKNAGTKPAEQKDAQQCDSCVLTNYLKKDNYVLITKVVTPTQTEARTSLKGGG